MTKDEAAVVIECSIKVKPEICLKCPMFNFCEKTVSRCICNVHEAAKVLYGKQDEPNKEGLGKIVEDWGKPGDSGIASVWKDKEGVLVLTMYSGDRTRFFKLDSLLAYEGDV
jgi:hypothetical protein